MKSQFIYIIIFLTTLYSQCDSFPSSECDSNSNCEWVEEIESVTCSSLVLDQELCEAAPECTYVCDDGGGYFGWCNSYCYGGMTYIDNGYCTEVEVLECSEMDGPNCNIDDSCEWVEEIEYGNCYGVAWNESNCDSYEGCEWACSMVWDSTLWQDVWSCDCEGQYEVDNSYCQEVEILDCSELNHGPCMNNGDCEWIDNTQTGSCSSLSLAVCDLSEYGSCYSDCTNWGSYYNGMFCYGTMYCAGGSYQIDTSYCEELEFQLGDINADFSINILDVIEIVNLILESEYSQVADMNYDSNVNVLDVVLIVDIILGN